MAKRRLTADEERRLAEAIEQAAEKDELPLENPRRVDRGASPTAVLSARVSLATIQRLREIAGKQGIRLSHVVNAAVETYAWEELPEEGPTFSVASIGQKQTPPPKKHLRFVSKSVPR